MSDEPTEGVSATGVVVDDSQSELFRITVKGTGVELTRTVDQATALNVIATVLGGAPLTPTATPSPRVASTPRVGPPGDRGDIPASADQFDPHMTIGEYIDACEAKRFPAKIAAIGNFLELKLGQQSFTRDEVKSQFRPAGEVLPGNYSRDFNDAITQRWISEVPGEKGQYSVTRTGKAAIAEKFGRPIRRPGTTRRKKATGKAENGGSASVDSSDFQDLDDE
jgi:hypothetical protein